MSIFTLERRTEVQEKLLEVGVELIREKGIRKMTISEIATAVGYSSASFFIRSFKKTEDVSPSEYRKSKHA